MFDIADGRNIWVSPIASSREDGSQEAPFSSIRTAIDAAVPGSTVVLMNGQYDEVVSIQERSGEETSPITICADPSAEAVILKAEWYFYGVSDFIISGLTFVETPNVALSIVGKSKRNIFKECLFISCGEKSECSLFFGGSGGEFNVVENCQFTRKGEPKNSAIMISQSVDSEDEKIEISSNSVVRFSTFENYGTAIILGSSDDIFDAGNHLVKENLFDTCNEGVRFKVNASEVRENIFRNCETGMNQLGGTECEIADNRFETCTMSLNLTRSDTTVEDNCIIDAPISVTTEKETILPTMISNNTFLFTSKNSAVTVTGEGSNLSVVISDNLIYNGTLSEHSEVRTHKNEHFAEGSIEFKSMAEGDFRCDTVTSGCRTEAAFRTIIKPLPQVDLRDHGVHDHGEAPISMDERDLYIKSLFMINEDEVLENTELIDDDEEEERPEDNEFYDFED